MSAATGSRRFRLRPPRRSDLIPVVIVLACAWVVGVTVAAVYVIDLGNENSAARSRQVQTFPASCQLYRAAERLGIIDGRALDRFLAKAPGPCPPLPPDWEQQFRDRRNTGG
jgi:hypothetical protein